MSAPDDNRPGSLKRLFSTSRDRHGSGQSPPSGIPRSVSRAAGGSPLASGTANPRPARTPSKRASLLSSLTGDRRFSVSSFSNLWHELAGTDRGGEPSNASSMHPTLRPVSTVCNASVSVPMRDTHPALRPLATSNSVNPASSPLSTMSNAPIQMSNAPIRMSDVTGLRRPLSGSGDANPTLRPLSTASNVSVASSGIVPFPDIEDMEDPFTDSFSNESTSTPGCAGPSQAAPQQAPRSQLHDRLREIYGDEMLKELYGDGTFASPSRANLSQRSTDTDEFTRILRGEDERNTTTGTSTTTATPSNLDQCSNCGRPPATGQRPYPVCGDCKSRRYCSKECQRKHWKSQHKRDCANLAKQTTSNGSSNLDYQVGTPRASKFEHPGEDPWEDSDSDSDGVIERARYEEYVRRYGHEDYVRRYGPPPCTVESEQQDELPEECVPRPRRTTTPAYQRTVSRRRSPYHSDPFPSRDTNELYDRYNIRDRVSIDDRAKDARKSFQSTMSENQAAFVDEFSRLRLGDAFGGFDDAPEQEEEKEEEAEEPSPYLECDEETAQKIADFLTRTCNDMILISRRFKKAIRYKCDASLALFKGAVYIEQPDEDCVDLDAMHDTLSRLIHILTEQLGYIRDCDLGFDMTLRNMKDDGHDPADVAGMVEQYEALYLSVMTKFQVAKEAILPEHDEDDEESEPDTETDSEPDEESVTFIDAIDDSGVKYSVALTGQLRQQLHEEMREQQEFYYSQAEHGQEPTEEFRFRPSDSLRDFLTEQLEKQTDEPDDTE